MAVASEAASFALSEVRLGLIPAVISPYVISAIGPRQALTVRALREDGTERTFTAIARLDTPIDALYYKNGGILQTVLRNLMKQD